MSILHVTDSDFQQAVMQSSKPVLVDYWAEWCGPCKMIAPVLEEMANEMGDKVTIGKMNIDDNPETPTQYGIRSIPTLMLFQNGQMVDSVSGAMSKQQLISWLESKL